jgi:hypothetical protein
VIVRDGTDSWLNLRPAHQLCLRGALTMVNHIVLNGNRSLRGPTDNGTAERCGPLVGVSTGPGEPWVAEFNVVRVPTMIKPKPR